MQWLGCSKKEKHTSVWKTEKAGKTQAEYVESESEF